MYIFIISKMNSNTKRHDAQFLIVSKQILIFIRFIHNYLFLLKIIDLIVIKSYIIASILGITSERFYFCQAALIFGKIYIVRF